MHSIIWQPGMTLEQAEKHIIQNALLFCRGNKTHTAKALGIAIRTLDSKLDKYEAEENERLAQQAEREEQNAKSLQAQRGFRVESADELPTKQQMSVRERQEIQEMPSSNHAQSGSHQKNAGKAAKGKGSK